MSLSPDHELHAELFRSCPELARVLLAARDVALPEGVLELSTIDASQALPTEARADVVVVVRDPNGAPRCAVIVEVQTIEDAAKRFSWPIYLAALRARLRCPTVLLVLATSPAVARWAARPIELGHPQLVLSPIVIGYDDIPRVTAPNVAPELAVLSARAHPELDVARTALIAIQALPEDTRKLYSQLALSTLPTLVRQALEEAMKPSPSLQKYLDDLDEQWAYERGMRKGVAQGLEKGVEQGRGEMQAVAIDLVGARLGARFDDALAQAVRRLTAPELTRLVRSLIPVLDETEALAIVRGACGVELR